MLRFRIFSIKMADYYFYSQPQTFSAWLETLKILLSKNITTLKAAGHPNKNQSSHLCQKRAATESPWLENNTVQSLLKIDSVRKPSKVGEGCKQNAFKGMFPACQGEFCVKVMNNNYLTCCRQLFGQPWSDKLMASLSETKTKMDFYCPETIPISKLSQQFAQINFRNLETIHIPVIYVEFSDFILKVCSQLNHFQFTLEVLPVKST